MATWVTRPEETRVRTVGIVLMSLLSAGLMIVLLRTPRSPEPPQAQAPASAQPVQSAGAPSAPQAPGSPPSEARQSSQYWLLFEGWPLPQFPGQPAPSPARPAPEEQ